MKRLHRVVTSRFDTPDEFMMLVTGIIKQQEEDPFERAGFHLCLQVVPVVSTNIPEGP
jgi:hypothetical protein